MRKIRARKLRQYDPDTGKLTYVVGFASPEDPSVENDMGKIIKPKNYAESMCFDELVKMGWTPSKKGWPDFFCVKDGKFCAVEVKPRKSHALKRNQLVVMGLLSQAGIKCFLWSPDGGFEEVNGMKKN